MKTFMMSTWLLRNEFNTDIVLLNLSIIMCARTVSAKFILSGND